MIFVPFDKQKEFLLSKARIKGAFAGRRGGKSEIGAIESIIHAQNQIGWDGSEIDEYIGVIIAPTMDMLRRLSLKKFMGFAKPFNPIVHKTFSEIKWPNGSLIYGISADRPERLEGIKANWIWMDEVFQMPEQIFTEAIARVADTRGKIWVTGSLGIQYTNPKNHWVYKYFKQKPILDSACFEWKTIDNPYFPRDEIERLRETLDPITYRQMFELSWDAQGSSLVYDEFNSSNIINNYKYNPELETWVSIDFGWTHPVAVLYFQYDKKTDTVYQFDEIVGSRITLEQLWDRMQLKPYRITGYTCDIAGTQEREQTGKSNIAWFKMPPRNVHMKFRSSSVQHGISLVRSYICNARGQRRFYIDETMCPRTIDDMKNFSYEVHNGQITSEVPKSKPDTCDAMRYFFVNHLDFMRQKPGMVDLDRWKFVAK